MRFHIPSNRRLQRDRHSTKRHIFSHKRNSFTAPRCRFYLKAISQSTALASAPRPLGADTDAVLRGLGYAEEDIAAMRATAAIG